MIIAPCYRLMKVPNKTSNKNTKKRPVTHSTPAENRNEQMSPLSVTDAIAAQKLEDENRELMVFFKAMDEVFFSVDMVNLKVIQISPACEKLYGYKQADFLANEQFWFGLMHPEDRHIIENEDIILRSGGQVTNQYRIIRKDKTIRWVENKIIPTLDENGTLIRVDGVTRDITARKEAIIQRRLDEEAIKKSEANLRTIFDNTDLHVFLCPDGVNAGTDGVHEVGKINIFLFFIYQVSGG